MKKLLVIVSLLLVPMRAFGMTGPDVNTAAGKAYQAASTATDLTQLGDFKKYAQEMVKGLTAELAVIKAKQVAAGPGSIKAKNLIGTSGNINNSLAEWNEALTAVNNLINSPEKKDAFIIAEAGKANTLRKSVLDSAGSYATNAAFKTLQAAYP